MTWDLLKKLGAPVRVAAADTDATLKGLLDQAESKIQVLLGMASKVPAIIVMARTKSDDLPEGRVHQAPVKKFLDDASEVLEDIDTLRYRLEDSELSEEKAKASVPVIRAMTVPRKASVAFAISDLDFAESGGITYGIETLKIWGLALADWSKDAKAKVSALKRKA